MIRKAGGADESPYIRRLDTKLRRDHLDRACSYVGFQTADYERGMAITKKDLQPAR